MSSFEDVIKFFGDMENCITKHLYLDSVTNGDATSFPTSFRVSDMCPNGKHLQTLSMRNISDIHIKFDMGNTADNYCLPITQNLRIGFNLAEITTTGGSLYFPDYLRKYIPPQLVYLDLAAYFNNTCP